LIGPGPCTAGTEVIRRRRGPDASSDDDHGRMPLA
jgi:hypothetical protein